jgi:hypothetical protein
MRIGLGLAVSISTLAITAPAFADCVTVHYRFFTRGDTVTTNETMLSGDTCFHALHNGPQFGNVFTNISVAQSPSHGTLAVGRASFQYRSLRGYRGPDSYAVKICMEKPGGHGCSTVVFEASIN